MGKWAKGFNESPSIGNGSPDLEVLGGGLASTSPEWKDLSAERGRGREAEMIDKPTN